MIVNWSQVQKIRWCLCFVDSCLVAVWRGLMKQQYGAQRSGWSMRGDGPKETETNWLGERATTQVVFNVLLLLLLENHRTGMPVV
jgi:hypothetical protein